MKRDGFLVSLAALGLYLLLGQDTFYKLDGPVLVLAQQKGVIAHPSHFAYMPLLAGLRALLEPFGLSAYRVAVVFSALGTALAVWLVHAALRTRVDRGGALLVALAVAVAPVNVLFATVVELHGPFLPFAALAFWAFARLDREPTAPRAVLAGLAVALSTAAHSTGVFLCVAFGGWFWARRRASGLVTVCLAIAVAGTFGVKLIGEATGLLAPPGANWRLFMAHFDREHNLGQIPGVLWFEWLRPFFPFGVLWVVAFVTQRVRAWVMTATLLFYLGAAYFFAADTAEHGAYLTPLSLLFPLLCHGLLGRRLFAVAVALSLLASVLVVRAHDRPEIARQFRQGVHSMTGGEPALLLVGHYDETSACLIACPEVEVHTLYQAGAEERTAAIVVAALADRRAVYLTFFGKRWIDERAAGLWQQLEKRFTVEPKGIFFRIR